MLDEKTKAAVQDNPLYYAQASTYLPSAREAAYLLGIGGLYDCACEASDDNKQQAWANYEEALLALRRVSADRDTWRSLARRAVDHIQAKHN